MSHQGKEHVGGGSRGRERCQRNTWPVGKKAAGRVRKKDWYSEVYKGRVKWGRAILWDLRSLGRGLGKRAKCGSRPQRLWREILNQCVCVIPGRCLFSQQVSISNTLNVRGEIQCVYLMICFVLYNLYHESPGTDVKSAVLQWKMCTCGNLATAIATSVEHFSVPEMFSHAISHFDPSHNVRQTVLSPFSCWQNKDGRGEGNCAGSLRKNVAEEALQGSSADLVACPSGAPGRP